MEALSFYGEKRNMSENNSASGRKAAKPGKGFLIGSLVFAFGFVANIIIGKISVMQGATQAMGIGDVGEFLILFVAVVLFIAACLARERAATAEKSPTNQ
jgi:hypothetical protein